MIGDWTRISQDGSLADLCKEKERKGVFGEIYEKTTREEYTLDWSQSNVFLVVGL